jgi:hypothetical protein
MGLREKHPVYSKLFDFPFFYEGIPFNNFKFSGAEKYNGVGSLHHLTVPQMRM